MNLNPTANKKKSRKVELKPGRSLLNWITYCASNPDLSSFYPNLKPKYITPTQLNEHKKVDDCWMCIQGNVYNLTHYMEYHPGGIEELMRGAGNDATSLFMEIHKWVNYPKLLSKCHIAPYKKISIESNSYIGKDITKTSNSISSGKNNDITNLLNSPPSVSNTQLPYDNIIRTSITGLPLLKPEFTHLNRDWLSLFVTSRNSHILYGFLAELGQSSLKMVFYLPGNRYTLNVGFLKPIKNFAKVDWSGTRKVEIDLHFDDLSAQTNRSDQANAAATDLDCNGLSNDVGSTELGKPKTTSPNIMKDSMPFEPLPHHDSLISTLGVADITYYRCQLVERSAVTHDTFQMKFELPPGVSALAPIGYHVYIKLELEIGIDLNKPYTPVPQSLCTNKRPGFANNNSTILPLSHRFLTFLVKVYIDGPMTQALHTLRIGEPVYISEFDGDFDDKIIYSGSFSSLLLIAAGSGITPILGILNRIFPHFDNCDNSSNPTPGKLTKSPIQRAVLVYFNKSEKDIIWDKKLKSAAETFPNNFSFENVLSQPEKSWKGSRGRISAQLLTAILWGPKDSDSRLQLKPADTYVCLCGSNAFNDNAFNVIKEMGFPEANIFAFK